MTVCGEIHRFPFIIERSAGLLLLLILFCLNFLQICSPVLCGWIAGHESEHMETLSEEEFRQSVTKLIHTFTG